MINRRALAAQLHDALAAALAWYLGYWLRFNLDVPVEYQQTLWQTLLLVVPLQCLVNASYSLYRGIWRYASVTDLRRIVVATVLTTGVVSVVLLQWQPTPGVPRSVLVTYPLLLTLLMAGSRVAYRAWRERSVRQALEMHGEPVLILGGGDAAVRLIRELEQQRVWRVVGLLDDNPLRLARMLRGVRVWGDLDSLPLWAARLGVRQVIVAMPSVDHSVRRRVVDLAVSLKLKVLTVPSYTDLLSGKVEVSALRRVELDDLLGRDPVHLDTSALRELLSDRVVLVTGAGGSIGSELVRQLRQFAPRQLVLVERSEFNLYAMEEELARETQQGMVVPVLADVCDRALMESVFRTYRPSLVFHAAAYKHVPMLETGNAWQGVRNNVLGTRVLAEVAAAYGVERFVLISTDKAVNPTNVMGASKRVCEMICQALQGQSPTRFVAVRFGNVLGSAGSVIPKFREQIERGGPVTVTHPDITRYFMTIPEAAQLVLQAAQLGQGGEVFVLDMGESVRIVDLAREMIRLSGLGEDQIRIEYTGLRPGEKLYEELLADSEQSGPTSHDKVRVAQARPAPPDLLQQLHDAFASAEPQPASEVRARLRAWVPEYTPFAEGADAAGREAPGDHPVPDAPHPADDRARRELNPTASGGSGVVA